VGGRLCAKTLNNGLFHFGAQFCKAQSSSLQNFLLENDAINFIGSSFDCEANDCVDTKNYFVGKRGMHALLKNYDQILNIKFNHRAVKIDEKNKLVHFESGKSESYDIIISSMPLPQAQKIYESKIEHDSKFSPCIAVGMTLNGTIDNQHNAYKNIDKDVAYLGSSHFYND
jgi:predicted NAD/FAD-dependent oxidoreductase